MAPWVSLAREGRIEIRMLAVGEDPRTTINRARAEVETGSVLALPHVLPTTGTVLPIEELAELVHKRKGMMVVQGSQALGMLDVNLAELDVDAYVASTSTWLGGPQGVAFAAIRPDLIAALTPRPALIDVRTPEYVVQRQHMVTSLRELETAAINPGLAAATTTCLDWMAAFGVDTARAYTTLLSRQLQADLSLIAGIEVLTSADDAARMPIVAFRVTRRPNTQVASWLMDEMKIRVHRLDNDNLEAVRVSVGLRNQLSDIQWLLRGAQALA
jgi:cysteine desulfurase/selenocysteine lyase